VKKITLSFDVLAAIIAVTILQACAKTALMQCAQPTLTPPGAPATTVTIKTTTTGAYLRYTLDGSTPTGGYGTPIAAQSGSLAGPLVFGRTLKAIAYKAGWDDSLVVVGKY
jgi:hypothetical protein